MIRHQPNRLLVSRMSDDILREDTRNPRRPMNPHLGIQNLHRNALGYRYSSPNGDNLLFGITGNPSDLSHLTVHCSLLTVHWTYTFSAKEKDSETGLSYFGSRYYSSDLSIWLSVDPMASKYPSLSPYVYCADNPVKLVDPNGEDTIFVNNRTGHSDVRISEGNDIMICGANKVTLSGNGVFAKAKGDKDQSNDSQTLLTGMTREDAAKVFNFMADNTNVEWGYMRTTSGECFVGANHSTEGEDGESLISNMVMDAAPNTVTNYTHSHWSDKYSTTGWNPSTFKTANNSKNSDHRAWKDILRTQSTITMGIRYRGSTKCWIRRGAPVDEYFKNKFYSTD